MRGQLCAVARIACRLAGLCRCVEFVRLAFRRLADPTIESLGELRLSWLMLQQQRALQPMGHPQGRPHRVAHCIQVKLSLAARSWWQCLATIIGPVPVGRGGGGREEGGREWYSRY